MSTNPFRRSSLKGPSGSGSGTLFVAGAPADIENTSVDAAVPLSLNTKVPTSTEKHVNFASPPAIPISPVSYPPSPESTRLSPAVPFSRPILPSPTDYSDAIQSDPFQAEAETDDGDIAIEQAIENAKANTTLVAPTLEASREQAVRNTLSRFAGAPRKPADATARNARDSQTPASHRQTMDVDAFKRLLLTGDSSSSTSRKSDDITSGTASMPVLTGDNSSGTDTASLSQKSFFDQGIAPDDSPRSSNDIDAADADIIRRSLTPNDTVEGRKKPPPPTPRRGKPAKHENIPEANVDPTLTAADDSLHQAAMEMSVPLGTTKKPPPPPLARRRSQSSNTPHAVSSRNSSSSEVDLTTNANDSNTRVPPPPRSRRPVATAERRSSSDLPPTAEESDAGEFAAASGRKTSGSRPPPPPTRNSGKRLSMATMNPPPLPPPRRGRGSSRSSMDGQRPSMSVIANSNNERASGEYTRPDAASRNTSSGSNVNDILADLAALQREVDEARGRSHNQ